MSLDTKAILEAVKQIRERSEKKKFNQSVELIINLQDIDMKKPEAKIQETIELPHTSSKKGKICVIATGELALKAKKAGADLIIDNSELEELATDKKRRKKLANDYGVFIAVPPSADIKTQIERSKKTITLRLRGQPVLQCTVGTEDLKDEQIVENVGTVIRRLEGKLKRGLKNITSIYLKTTMGKPVKVKL